uniref:CRAL-TRIO domain-containing protein n=1 Tax=viral metagenome TaxID=1070528 RepID=A0A6C0JX72_9ZZZZ
MSGNPHTETNDLLARINNLRNEYENENKKGFFPSKQYKFDCANNVLKTIDLDTLLNSTLTVLPNSYHLFFDYTVFKTFATPELYDTIMKYAISKIMNCINMYGTYEMHVNLNTFSVSAFHRYRPIIELYSHECNTNYQIFHEKLKTMHIYNVPSTVETISQLIGPLLPPIVRQKVVKYDKSASEKPLQTITEIMQTMNTIQPLTFSTSETL